MSEEKKHIFSFEDAYNIKKTESKSHLGKKFSNLKARAKPNDTPPFPRNVIIEINTICNHNCIFCDQSEITRPKVSMSMETFERLIRESYELGAREVSLGGGAEPLYSRELEQMIAFCKKIGYEYIYTTTNGSIAGNDRWKNLIDAGLDSVKISINGGNRENYEKIHGKDHFDRVIDGIRFINRYRQAIDRPLFLGVSFVEHPDNAGTFDNLKQMIEGDVDEVIMSRALKNPTNREDFATDEKETYAHLIQSDELLCHQPFSQIVFSVEGHLRACCIEWDNVMTIEDLREMSVAEAWHSRGMRDLRTRLIAEDSSKGNLRGTLCHRCIYGGNSDFKPINPAIYKATRG